MSSILEHVASTTPTTDKEPVKLKVKVPRGTIYWGGAGLNGGYVQPQIEAFRKAGIKHIWVGFTNTATKVMGGEFGTIVDAIRAGLIIRYEDESPWTIDSGMDQPAEQFNRKIAWLKNALGERYEQIVPKEYQNIFEEGDYHSYHCFENYFAKQWLNRVYRRMKNVPHLVAYRIWNKSLHFLDLYYKDFESYRKHISGMFVKQINHECDPDYPKFEEFGLKG